MSNIVRGHPATFVVLGDLFWNQSPCNLSLRTGRYAAVPALRREADGSEEPLRWEIRKDAGLLTMSPLQAEAFQQEGKLLIVQ